MSGKAKWYVFCVIAWSSVAHWWWGFSIVSTVLGFTIGWWIGEGVRWAVRR